MHMQNLVKFQSIRSQDIERKLAKSEWRTTWKEYYAHPLFVWGGYNKIYWITMGLDERLGWEKKHIWITCS